MREHQTGTIYIYIYIAVRVIKSATSLEGDAAIYVLRSSVGDARDFFKYFN